MFIYVFSPITNKVLVPHNTENLTTDVQFFEVALKLLIKLNHKALPANIQVGNDYVVHLGIEITGCKMTIAQAKYGIFIQNLTSDAFALYCETTTPPTDI
jgi:hypothetical protein|tara:strand:- start:123 stop:422 length:300 start_codon:yes stop_codon:yes gene_type:complete